MRTCFLLLLLAALPSPSFCQNLVKNPSFEKFRPGREVVPCQFMESGILAETIEDWTSFVDMTPDVHRASESCPYLTEAHTGNHCAGIIYYLPSKDSGHKNGYREAIQGELLRPMLPGKTYRVSIWLREHPDMMQDHLKRIYSDKTPVVSVKASHLGFLFTVSPLDSRYSLMQQVRDLNLKPQVVYKTPFAPNEKWLNISMTFVPDRPFQYFTFGNFFPDEQVSTDLPEYRNHLIDSLNDLQRSAPLRIKRVAYVCADDVYVGLEKSPAGQPRADTLISLETKMLKERRYTFSASVLFDSGKADLRPEASPALDSLTQFLRKYPRLRVGISGHTDDVGTDEDNQALSARRAQAVHARLLEQGIPPAQVEWKAFGETRPIADNDTEAGRQRNRRVECVLLGNAPKTR
ncbi:MAG TPA: OmpA family protein [Saprospiraceae bacterium]|nr:OmpA family protein [Saprospiraceae bacterium]